MITAGLRIGAGAYSPAVVSASLFPALRIAIVTFCVALSLVYATASAAGVVNQLQHQGQPDLHHQHSAFSDLSFDNHPQDGDHDDHSQPPADGADTSQDRDTGQHHHHADGPQGLLGSVAAYGALDGRPGARPAAGSDKLITGPGPSGPERPPKGLTVSV